MGNPALSAHQLQRLRRLLRILDGAEEAARPLAAANLSWLMYYYKVDRYGGLSLADVDAIANSVLVREETVFYRTTHVDLANPEQAERLGHRRMVIATPRQTRLLEVWITLRGTAHGAWEQDLAHCSVRHHQHHNVSSQGMLAHTGMQTCLRGCKPQPVTDSLIMQAIQAKQGSEAIWKTMVDRWVTEFGPSQPLWEMTSS